MSQPRSISRTRAPRKPDIPSAYDLLAAEVIDYVWRLDESGVILEIHASPKNLLGYSPAKLIGKPMDELVTPATRANVHERLVRRLAERTSFGAEELAMNAKDGRELWFEVAGVPQTDAKGRFVGYWGVVKDITARKRVEAALLYHDQLLNGITRSAAELVGAASIDAAMPRALEVMSKALGADRLMVVEDVDPVHPGWKLRMTHIWQADDVEPIDSRTFANLSSTRDLGPWARTLAEGRVIAASADTASDKEAALLGMLRSRSTMVIPIRALGRAWGGLQIDDCRGSRQWSRPEIDALTTFAEMVGGTIARWHHLVSRRRAELELKRSGSRDLLTGLPNRRGLIKAMAKGRSRSRMARAGPCAIHYLDLDHFKDVNDSVGHIVGDALLTEVARRLQELVRHTDLVARFGGDEFVILQADVSSPDQAENLARKLVSGVMRPFHIGGHEIRVGASIGVAPSGEGGVDPETLLAHAELALYKAKAEGRQTFRIYTEDMDLEARSRVILGDDLHRAIVEKQFFMVYQPQVHLDGNRIVGLEALIRWRHPRRGVVGPADFIEAAERTGAILAIGAWCLDEVCRQAKAWLDAGIAPPVIGVNTSAVQVRRPDELKHQVFSALEKTGLPAGMLQLELTETTLMEASRAQSDLLVCLSETGVKISLDDFGTGYSSLDYLRRYPVDQIKIAQVFVNGLERSPGDATIVRATIGLARELGLQVIAEGAETAAQVKLLEAWGCKEIQGWYFSEALTAEAIEPLLRRGSIDPAPPAAEPGAMPAPPSLHAS